MPRDPRTFITLHDGMPDHPKVEGLSDAAFRLLITTWCWCARNKTDGKVALASWNKRGTPKSRRELLTAGLAETSDDDIYMHDYTEHQRTAEEIEELSRKRAEAGRRGGRVKAKRVASATASARRVAKQTSSKSVAETDLLEVSNKRPPVGAAAPTAQDLIGEWIRNCRDRPPSAVVGQVSKLVGQLLNEDQVPYPEVRRGVQVWQERALHPATLPSIIHELRGAKTKSVSAAPFTPPPPPDDMPEEMFGPWNRAHKQAQAAGRPGPTDWRELQEAS